MTTIQTPTTQELEARFQVYSMAINLGMADMFFADDDPDYLMGMKDTIEFLTTGQRPARFS